MFLSVSSWIFQDLPEREMLEAARRCGYSHVEVSAQNWPARWDWPVLTATAADLGIRILSVHCCHHEMPDEALDDRAYREYPERFYENLECAKGVVVVEHESHRYDEARDIPRACYLRRLGEEHGLAVSFENMASPVEKLSKLIGESGVRFTFDPMHAVDAAHVPILSYEPLFAHLVNVHAMDKIPGLGLSHAVPCGQGSLCWPETIQALARHGYQGPVVVEMQMSPVRRVLEMCAAVYGDAFTPAAGVFARIPVEEAFATSAGRALAREIAVSAGLSDREIHEGPAR